MSLVEYGDGTSPSDAQESWDLLIRTDVVRRPNLILSMVRGGGEPE
jgi:hypothetical protein